jgi:hypothetical protein
MGLVFISLFGSLVMGLGRDLYVWASAAFLALLFAPIANGSSQAIWQAKVAPDVQGRVFSTRLLIAQISAPLATLIAGPLADALFEPGMRGGRLVPIFGWMVGSGPGAGMGVMLVIAGTLGVAAGFVGYSFRVIRNAEDILPDHDAQAAASAGAA